MPTARTSIKEGEKFAEDEMMLPRLFIGAYALAAALAIVAFWSFQPMKERTASKAHLAAELLTAAVLATGGAGLLLGMLWATLTTAVGLGMLGYAGLNIIGKYLGEGNRAMVATLLAEEFLTLVAVVTLLSDL